MSTSIESGTYPIDRPHECELGRERLFRERVPLGPLEPHGDGVTPELLDVIVGEPDDLGSLGLVLVPGSEVLLLNIGVLVPRMLARRGDHDVLQVLGQRVPFRHVDREVHKGLPAGGGTVSRVDP